jgi:hypothetical protein
MGNTQSLTDVTRNAQDAQYTSALQSMTPSQRQAYFDTQKTQLINKLLDERESTFQKTYTDMVKNTNVQHSLLYYMSRNSDLNDVGSYIKNQNQNVINTATYNKSLAERQNQVNEWAYNNKLDTLFVFQLIFISLCITAFLAFLQRLGYFSNAFFGIVIGILLFVMAVTIANRANYTNQVRDKRFWNRAQFGHYDVSGGTPDICPPESSLDISGNNSF